MFALNHLTFILIFTTVVSGFINGEQYQADSDVERLPEIQAAAMIDKNTIDETATNNKSRQRNVARAHGDAADVNDDENHTSGLVDDTQQKFSPKFKHPSKMFNLDMKPVGSSIRLKCAADGNPTPNITWYKNNDTIARRYFQPSYGKWSMSLDELTKTDNGNYTCLVCNELGCISHTVMLHVQERIYSKPVLTRGPVNQTKLVGETANFSCEFLSDMHHAIYWMYYKKYEYIYNHTVTADSRDVNDNRIMTDDNINNQPEILTLYNVTKEDEGWYVCVAINTLGKTSAIGYLTVLDSIPGTAVLDYERYLSRPSIKEGYPGNKTAFVYDTVRLTCPMLSQLDYLLYWLKPAKNYIGNSHVGAEEPIPKGLVIQSDDDSDKPEVLTLYNVTKEKGGWYVCVALNTLGRASAKGYLTVLDRNNQHN